MDITMPNNLIFGIAFTELAVSFLLGLFLLRLQIKTLRPKTQLQGLKRLLIASVVFLMLSSMPLILVYSDALWFHKNSQWIVYTAVLMNSTSVLLVKVILILIYLFQP